MAVTGNAKLVLSDKFVLKGDAYIYIAPGASLTLYVARDVALSGSSSVNKGGTPAQFTLYGTSTSQQFYMSETSFLVGTVDAPTSKLDQTGDSVFCGSGIFNQVVVGGQARFHYDEALSASGANGSPYIVTSWNEL
jgi:hypothetical protein